MSFYARPDKAVLRGPLEPEFHTDTGELTEGHEPRVQRLVAAPVRGERSHLEHTAVAVHHRGDVFIQMGVDAPGDRARAFYDGHAIPFLCSVVGWHARPGKETVTNLLRQQRVRSPSGTGRAPFVNRARSTITVIITKINESERDAGR
jgi:hypothetical protein